MIIKYNAEKNLRTNESNSLVHLSMQPIKAMIGFKEINEFKIVYERLMSILDSLSVQNKNLVERIQQDYAEIMATTEAYKENRRKIIPKIKKLAQKKQLETMKIKIEVDSFKVSLVDDTGLYHQLLLSFDFDNIKTILKLEMGQEDPVSFILRRLGIYTLPYLDGVLSLNLEAYSYNFESGAREPLVEPWEMKMRLRKALPSNFVTEGQISLESNKDLNINLTYGVAIVINKTMKQLLESSEGETINVEEYKSDNIDIKEEKIEFINNLGVDMKA